MKELLIKYIQGNCSNEEKISILAWIEQSEEHRQEYDALRKLNDIILWSSPEIDEMPRRARNIRPLKSVLLETLKIASIFIFAFFALQFADKHIFEKNTLEYQALYVPAGQRAEFTLQDGTKVWLNANATLKIPTKFGNDSRTVILDGEGFFDVTHDEKRPFIVSSNGYDVKVWGTKFNLINYSGRSAFETSLLEGSVEVLKTGHDKGLFIKPNERVVMKNGALKIENIQDLCYFDWRNGIISLDNASFSEIMEKLEMYFDVDIEVMNLALLELSYTGKFRMKDGINHILEVLKVKGGFEYELDDRLNKNKIIIK